MVTITKKTWEKNGVVVINFNGKKRLNKKHIEQVLEQSNVKEVFHIFTRFKKKKTRIRRM